MKYALLNGERQEAQRSYSGKCLCCGNPVIAKCGTVRVHHWAHERKSKCDSWWENETEWHRSWKNCFPKEQQEIIHFAENGEKHIADVKTVHGYIIEFQHSSIKHEERQARESFYKRMIWIVDGTRRLKDRNRFTVTWELSKAIGDEIDVRILNSYGDKCALLQDWKSSNVPVFFDFGDSMLTGLLFSDDIIYALKIDRSTLIAALNGTSHKSFEELWKDIVIYIAFTFQKRIRRMRQQSFQPQLTNYCSRNRRKRL